MKWANHLAFFLAFFIGWCDITKTWGGAQSYSPATSIKTKEHLSLHDLKTLLAIRSSYKANFQETHFSSLLTEPLATSGTLRFTPPSKLEKHITAPFEERYWIEGNEVHYESSEISTSFSLSEYPGLQGFLLGLRSALTGDYQILQRFFSLTLDGTKDQWTLRLIPLDESTLEILSSLTIMGQNGLLTSMEMHEANGDHSILVLDESIK